MKVLAYRVFPRNEQRLEAVLEYINQQSLERKLREVWGMRTRLEIAQPVRSGWYVDFGLIRHDGPGRASPNSPITDFSLNPDEGFGEETAGYYDIASRYFIFQYNHYGPKVKTIQAYINKFARDMARGRRIDDDDDGGHVGFDIHPVLRGDSLDRLREKEVIKSIEFTVSASALRANGQGARQSLSAVLESPLAGGAETVHMKVSAGRARERGLSIGNVTRAVSDLIGLGDDLSALKVVAKENPDAPSEPIDFVAERLMRNFNIVADENSRRYLRNERWDALRQAFNGWVEDGRLTP